MVYEGRGTTDVHVDDRDFVLDTFGWKLDGNSLITFQPSLDGRCVVVTQLPGVTRVTDSELVDKTWKTNTVPYSWSTLSAFNFKPGQPSFVGGETNTIWDYVTSAEAYPPTIQRVLHIHELGGNGAIVDWTVQWTIEPIGKCTETSSAAGALNVVTAAKRKPTIAGPMKSGGSTERDQGITRRSSTYVPIRPLPALAIGR